MPRVGTAWRRWSFVAFTIDDYDREHEHHRGLTRNHALRRLHRSWM